MPAGSYMFTYAAGSVVVRVKSAATDGQIVLTNPESSFVNPQDPQLVFHCYGNQRFLTRIEATFSRRDIPTSPTEREAEQNVAEGRQVSKTVYLAAR